MKTLLRSCLVLLFFCAVTVSEAAAMPTNTINAVLGDVSFVKKFGTAPTPASGEALRIRTHLEYVETLLRAEDVSHLSSTLRERRAALLDKLHEYRLTSVFPTNLDFPRERRPCFIDAAGNICAVGFLIEQTAGRALAERINAAHRYDVLPDMHVPELTAWVEASGLTARECAMIQPGYGPRFDANFNIISISPSVTTHSVSPFTVRLEVVGIFQIPYLPASLGIEVQSAYRRNGFVWSDKTLALPTPTLILTTSATIGGYPRLNGQVIFTFPGDSAALSEYAERNELLYVITLRSWATVYSDPFLTSTVLTTRVANSTSVRDLTLSSTIPISPNPVTDALTLALPENELHSVRLTNTLGCAVWTLSEASGTTTLDVGGLSAGVYFVEVQSARRRSVQKVVKY